MSFAVRPTPGFKRMLKRLERKYPSLSKDVLALVVELSNNPSQGTPLGAGLFKVRLAIRSKSQGRSGGGRVITWVRVVREQVILIAIYDKSEMASISMKELKSMAKEADADFG